MKTNEFGKLEHCRCSAKERMLTSSCLCIRCGGYKPEEDNGIDVELDVELGAELGSPASRRWMAIAALTLALIWLCVAVWYRSAA